MAGALTSDFTSGIVEYA